MDEDDDNRLLSIESSDELIERFFNFYYRHVNEQRQIQDFEERYCQQFSGYASDEEQDHDHECMTIFQKYEQMMEQILHQFLDQDGSLSLIQFIDHCERAKISNPDAFRNLTCILSAFDFSQFCIHMRERAHEQHRAGKEAEDMGF